MTRVHTAIPVFGSVVKIFHGQVDACTIKVNLECMHV